MVLTTKPEEKEIDSCPQVPKYQGTKNFTLLAHAGANLSWYRPDVSEYITLTSKIIFFTLHG